MFYSPDFGVFPRIIKKIKDKGTSEDNVLYLQKTFVDGAGIESRDHSTSLQSSQSHKGDMSLILLFSGVKNKYF